VRGGSGISMRVGCCDEAGQGLGKGMDVVTNDPTCNDGAYRPRRQAPS